MSKLFPFGGRKKLDKKECIVSIITPVYNMQKYLHRSVESVINQSFDKEKIELLLIDDGSTDSSPKLCDQFAEKYDFIHVFHKENSGPARARNLGIENAKGKYILYLDSDDSITEDTIQSLVSFFDKHYDDVDIVNYMEIPVNENGTKKGIHYRYDYLKHSGVYNLLDNDNIYISQTNMNIIVKNLFDKNIYFDTNPEFRHEDQKYCIENIMMKDKLGFCDKGEYHYLQHSGSIVHTYFYAYYIFETSTSFWETLFASYDVGKVPKYIQAMFINDLSWKIKDDILFPYHYEEPEFKKAVSRIIKLLKQVDDDVIIKYPKINEYHAIYFLQMKCEDELRVLNGPTDFAILHSNKILFSFKYITLFVSRLQIKNGRIKMLAHLRSPIFNVTEKPELYMIKNDYFNLKEAIDLKFSAWSYYTTKVCTNRMWGFEINIPTENLNSLLFKVKLCGRFYPVTFQFAALTPFNMSYKRNPIFADGLMIKYGQGKLTFSPAIKEDEKEQNKILNKFYLVNGKKFYLLRKAARQFRKLNRKIWLYYDCTGVKMDNSYFQFIHDFEKKDGIERYYIINDKIDRSELFTSSQKRHLIDFGSLKHKLYFLSCDKVITAFAERENYIPFDSSQLPHYADFMTFDLIYLQHGVLHAHLPWKYSLDRINVDKEVISTRFEYRNLTDNYGFTDEHLIKSGMPRYDHIDKNAQADNCILYAPSWRKYLVGMDVNGRWVTTGKKFINSDFFKASSEFLSSPRLAEMLEKYDYTFEFKLHPIFERYKDFYKIDSPRISMAAQGGNEARFKVFITDFSSYQFDFIYLQRPLIHFMPDYEIFRSGMNDYRELDLSFEDGIGEFALTSDEALDSLEKLLENNCVPDEKHREKTENFFFENDSHEDALYQELIKD